jgi:arsenite methyltransferase
MDENTAGERIKEAVRQAYGDVARRSLGEPARPSCCGPSEPSCCGPSEPSCCAASQPADCACAPSEASADTPSAAARLYGTDILAELPASVTDMSLGCGDPTVTAELQAGEVVLDLGSGGGIDCFLVARKVGPKGRVIGLDMTPDMIRLARRNARKMGVANVDFRYGEMEDIPLPDASVDVIISNCVINLSPDKDAVFAEAYRVLRPGGRLTVSDIVTDGELPESIRSSLDAWAGCVSGALDEAEYLAKMRAAGLEQVQVVSRDFVKISEFEEWEAVRAALAEAGLPAVALDHTVASVRVKARKPA